MDKLNKFSKRVINDYKTTITILEHLSEAIFMIDIDGVIQYANQIALEMLNMEFSQVRGLLIDQVLLYAKNSNNNGETLTHQIQNGNCFDLDSFIVYNNLSIPVKATFNVINNSDGQIEMILVSAKDLTIQKSLENDLQRQQILSISRDRIRALGELSVNMVHELSQPLSSLQMRLELLKGDLNTSQNTKQIEQQFFEINTLIQRMNKSVDVIRNFANQTEDESIGLVNLPQSIRNARRLVGYELSKYGIKFEIGNVEDMPFILGNSLLVEQIFVNLFVNSKDAFASDEAIKSPTIKVISEMMNNKWLEIRVIDNGPGINAIQKEKIFEPFFTTKSIKDNPGLGLTIAKEIVDSIGGKIYLDQTETSDTCFVVRLPMVQDNDRDQLANLIEMFHSE